MKDQKKQALAKYVKRQINSGQDAQVLKEELKDKGWSADEITAVFAAAGIEERAEDEELEKADEATNQQSEPVDPFTDTEEIDQGTQKATDVSNNTDAPEPPHPSYAQDGADQQSSAATESHSDSQNQSAGTQFNGGEQGTGDRTGFKFEQFADRNGSWTTAGIVSLVVGVLILVGVGGVLAFTNLVNDSTANPPGIEAVYQAHKSVDFLKYDTSMNASLDLNVTELQARDDFDRLKQALTYIPNTGDIGEVPESLQMGLSVGGSADFAVQNSAGKTTIQLAFGGNELQNILDIELRFVDEVGYVNAKTLPSVPMFPTQSFENQWFSFTASSTPGQFQSVSTSVGDTELSDASIIGILKALQSSGLVSIEGGSSDELADGNDAYKYTLNIHPKNYAAFAREVEAIISQKQPELADRQEFKEAMNEINQSTSSASEVPEKIGPIEVLVASESQRLRRATFEKTYSKQDIKDMADSENEDDRLAGMNSATLSFEVGLSDYNQRETVQKPADTTPIKEAMQNLPFFGGMSEARTSSRDARRQTDLNQIRTGLALYRDKQGSYPSNLYEGPDSLAESGAMTQVPTDPSDDTGYAYTTNTDASDFCVGAALEDDSSLPANNNEQCVEDLKSAGGSADINYAISG